MTKTFLIALAVAAVSVCTFSSVRADEYNLQMRDNTQIEATDAASMNTPVKERLMVINGNTGRVVYDDGHDDVVCIKRKKVVNYDWYGRPIYGRTVKCH